MFHYLDENVREENEQLPEIVKVLKEHCKQIKESKIPRVSSFTPEMHTTLLPSLFL